MDEAGFTYAYSLFEIDFLVGLSTVDPQNRVKQVADRVKAATEEREFKDEVERLFTESTLLSARWTAVQQD